MVLQPRKFKYKLRQKSRSLFSSYKPSKLSFGQAGLLLLQPLRLNSKNIFRIKLFIKKSARRSDNTKRRVLINVFPHLPLTKKVIGSRMGKGKGKLAIWFTQLPVGHIFIESKNLRNGRMKYFFKQLQFRLKSSTKILYKIDSSKNNILSALGTNRIGFQSFW